MITMVGSFLLSPYQHPLPIAVSAAATVVSTSVVAVGGGLVFVVADLVVSVVLPDFSPVALLVSA